LGYVDAIQSSEVGFAFEAMLESMPQIFHTASIWYKKSLQNLNLCIEQKHQQKIERNSKKSIEQ